MAARFLLRVEGMVCGRCTAKVERVLLSVDGVEFARADLVSKQVDVLAAPQATRHHLVDALEGHPRELGLVGEVSGVGKVA